MMSLRALPLLALLALGAGCGTDKVVHQPGGGNGTTGRDPDRDIDGDWVTPGEGDCNDDNPTIFPGAMELCDGKDHDCDFIVDGTCDVDRDGYAAKAGGAVPAGDCDDSDPAVGPNAIEVPADRVDNNCDGRVDEAEIGPCDQDTNKSDPRNLAAAMGICAPWLLDAKLNREAHAQAYDIRSRFGRNYSPKGGANLLLMSTGIAADKFDPTFASPEYGTDFGETAPNPLPIDIQNNVCGVDMTDPKVVNDYLELTLTLRVPSNAHSFSFNLNFFSAEYPEYVGTAYNDKFYALLASRSFNGNISFDPYLRPITVNNSFFAICDTSPICNGLKSNMCSRPLSDLSGTGYEDQDPATINQLAIGGATGWLTTTSPVTPGEIATLRFSIFDEADHVWDSAVLLDNFRWHADPASEPVTVP